MPEKLKKWKVGLTRLDLGTTASFEPPKSTSETDDVAEDEDEELPQLNTHQLTEGHRELVDGELWMVDDEELRRRQEDHDVEEDDE